MILVVIELFVNVFFLVLSVFSYLSRKKLFRNVIVRRKTEKADLILKVLFILCISTIILFYILNIGIYIRRDFTKRNDLLILITINQLIFWSSLYINVRSFKFVKESELVEFNYPSKSEATEGEVKAGVIVNKGKEKYDYYIKLKDLQRHCFVTGITGSGKSNFFQNFLIDYKSKYDTPILLTEFKGEYHYLQRIIPNLLIFKVGKSFCINIFDPLGDNYQNHAERIFQIFKSGGLFETTEYSPQMERVFIDVLRRVCKDPTKRSWKKFYEESLEYLKDSKKNNPFYDSTFKSSVIAVQNRIRRYSLGTLRHAFEEERGLNAKEIFKHNVLLDVSSLLQLGGEKEDTLFFLNMLLKYLWDKNIKEGSKDYKGIKHITIIEDAQYFASQTTTKKSTVSSYIEDIALLLRGTGECLIALATRPAISPEILANTGIFISFQNHMQKDYLQDLLNFDDKQRKYLSMLPVGDCIIRVNSIGKPFGMKIPYIERGWLDEDEINQNNERILGLIKKKNMEIDDIKQEEIEIKQEEKKKMKQKIRELLLKTKIRLKKRVKTENKVNIEKPILEEKKDKTELTTFCRFCGGEIDRDSEYCKGCEVVLKEEDKSIEELKSFENDENFKELKSFVEELYNSQNKGTIEVKPKTKTNTKKKIQRIRRKIL